MSTMQLAVPSHLRAARSARRQLSFRSAWPTFLKVVLAVATLAPPAAAHESLVPIAADAYDLRTKRANSFSVTITDQEAILLTHDPRVTESAIITYGTGTGTGGENAGGTGRITLDPTFWTEVLEGSEFAGYAYDDPDGTRGGITSIAYRNRELHVEGSGENWTWQPAGPQDEVWFLFVISDESLCAEFDGASAAQLSNEAGKLNFLDAAAPAACEEQVCGNGIRELPEVCDDGNLEDGDGCSATCESVECEAPDFASTFEGIQQIIFSSPVYGCDNELCHNPAVTEPKAGLDLTAGNSYDQLIRQPSSSPFFTITDSGVDLEFLDRVVPGEAAASMLFQVLEAKTNGNPHNIPSMPENGGPVLEDHLAAIERWIRTGAPRDLVVEGTAGLLGACLPPEDPLKLDEPPMPPKGEAIQLQQTAWDLPHSFEDEICMATWYDFTKTDLVPESAQLDCPEFSLVNNPSGKCFAYNRRVLLQDGQSHHSIIQIYDGEQGLLDEGPPGQADRKFGPFTYKQNALDDPLRGMPCDPTDVDPATGFNKDCSGVVVSGATCTGFGPVDVFEAPAFAGSQEPFVDNTNPDGVFATLPMSGIVVWNSHAFNLTRKDSTMAQYLDIYFAFKDEQRFPQRGIFDISKIYIQQVPPFEKREYCKTYTIAEGASLYELSSHTHRWGTKFRIFGPPNEPCDPGDTGGLLAGNAFTCEPDCACGPGDPDQLLYFSTEYSDPVQLEIDPPMTFGDSVQDRTFIFCSEYDNGSTPTSPPVKRQSMSPSPPPFEFAGLELEIGGPCPDDDTTWLGQFPLHGVACMDGPNKGVACGTEDAASFCETAPGLGDGVCDACEVLGGFTTEDEMFILLGNYFRGADSPVVEPVLDAVIPSSGTQGGAIAVLITGENTSFNAGSTVTFGEGSAGIAVTSTTVESETAIRVEIEIAADAPVGTVDVSVSTDAVGESEAALRAAAVVTSLADAFEILERPFDPLPENGKVLGCVEPGGDFFYEFESAGLENLSVKIKGREGRDGQGRLRPTLSLIDPDGLSEVLATARNRSKPAKVKNAPILTAGTYLLRIADADGEGGCFGGTVRVRGNGPEGRSRGVGADGTNPGVRGKWRLHECIADGDAFVLPFVPEQGAKLALKVKGKARDGRGALAPKASLALPGGGERALGDSGDKLKIGNVQLILGGEHQLTIESREEDGGGCFEAELLLK